MNDEVIDKILNESKCANCAYSAYREWIDPEDGEEACDFTCVPLQVNLLDHFVTFCSLFEEPVEDHPFSNNKFL